MMINTRGENLEDEYVLSNILELGLKRERGGRSLQLPTVDRALDLELED